MAGVYIIEGESKYDPDKILRYIGSTTRTIRKRLEEHKLGMSHYTRRMKNIRLRYALFIDATYVRGVEYYLKKHPRVVKYIFGDESAKRSYETFKRWLDDRGIQVKKEVRL